MKLKSVAARIPDMSLGLPVISRQSLANEKVRKYIIGKINKVIGVIESLYERTMT